MWSFRPIDDDFDLGFEIINRTQKLKSWHARRNKNEPACSNKQWRTRNRTEVINICDMSDSHLAHAIRFAKTKQHHRSKLGALEAEAYRRLKQLCLHSMKI